MNAKHLVVERGEAVKKYVGFCGGPSARKGQYCPWQSQPQPSGEQAERLVIDHYAAAHPKLLAKAVAGAMNGKLVGAPIVSRVDLDCDLHLIDGDAGPISGNVVPS